MNRKSKSSQDDEWMYKPILQGAFSTRTDYDGNGIEQYMIDSYEQLD